MARGDVVGVVPPEGPVDHRPQGRQVGAGDIGDVDEVPHLAAVLEDLRQLGPARARSGTWRQRRSTACPEASPGRRRCGTAAPPQPRRPGAPTQPRSAPARPCSRRRTSAGRGARTRRRATSPTGGRTPGSGSRSRRPRASRPNAARAPGHRAPRRCSDPRRRRPSRTRAPGGRHPQHASLPAARRCRGRCGRRSRAGRRPSPRPRRRLPGGTRRRPRRAAPATTLRPGRRAGAFRRVGWLRRGPSAASGRRGPRRARRPRAPRRRRYR